MKEELSYGHFISDQCSSGRQVEDSDVDSRAEEMQGK